jgi:hypothetical protein
MISGLLDNPFKVLIILVVITVLLGTLALAWVVLRALIDFLRR